MDILAGLKDKLRFIEWYYAAASEPFIKTIAKIRKGEAPFEPPPIGEDGPESDEPPFLEEWLDAGEAKNIVGQSALSLVQSAFKKYLESFIDLSGRKLPTGGNWFERYRTFFLEQYEIDWGAGPVPLRDLEEINLTRADIHHSEQEFGMARHMNKKHFKRFPDGLFAHELDLQIQAEWEHGMSPPRIHVTRENLEEAIRRVKGFCEFIDLKRPP